MKIYVSHSQNFDFRNELYAPIKHSSLVKKHQFILPHEESNELFNTKELFQLKRCDLIIAEVSFSSTGQGIELGWADVFEIPIVCFYKEGALLSESLHKISKKFLMYTSKEDMMEDIIGVLKQYE